MPQNMKPKGEAVRQAASKLLELARKAETVAPERYQDWEEEYARLKWSNHDE